MTQFMQWLIIKKKKGSGIKEKNNEQSASNKKG